MTNEAYRRTCYSCYVGALVFLGSLAAFLIFGVFNNSPVLDFGTANDLWLSVECHQAPVEVHPAGTDSSTMQIDPKAKPRLICPRAQKIALNEKPQLVFGKITWLRLCDTIEPQFIKIDGHRFDLSPHYVVAPAHTGALHDLPKSRWIVDDKPVPMGTLTLGVTGPAEFWMHVKSTCWWSHPIEMDTPHYRFEVVANDQSGH